MMHVMTKSKKTKNKAQPQLLKRLWHPKLFFAVVPILLIALYLNVANNHFYHRLHTAGLPWPQNKTSYIIGNESSQKTLYAALGDSLTSGVGTQSFEASYPFAVAKQIVKPNEHIDLRPLSTPGFKSKDIIDEYLQEAVLLKPKIVTVLIGVNDVHGMSPSQKEFQDNYEKIVSRLHNETNAKIYAIGIPYIGTDNLIWPPYRNYYSERTKLFNKSIRAIANKYNATYIDLYTPTLPYASKSSRYYSADDFHPSAEGYALWAGVIARDINY